MEKPKVLVVDDEPENIEYLQRAFRRHYDVYVAANGQMALEQLRKQQFGAVVSDHRMPGMNGVELLRQVFLMAPDTVRIMLTGFADLDATIDAINLSQVAGFIRKPATPEELLHAVASALEMQALRAGNQALVKQLEERTHQLEEKERLLELSLDEKSKELLAMNKRLEELVSRDGLTGLYNHKYLQDRTEQEVQRAERHELNLSLVFFDLDHFKAYNDLNGHPAGDRALIKVADILTGESREQEPKVRGSDVVARYGGEEFVVLLPETPKNGARIMAERVRLSIERQRFPGDEKLPSGKLTVSAGVATYPGDARSRDELFARADESLYRAKARGRNRIAVYGESD